MCEIKHSSGISRGLLLSFINSLSSDKDVSINPARLIITTHFGIRREDRSRGEFSVGMPMLKVLRVFLAVGKWVSKLGRSRGSVERIDIRRDLSLCICPVFSKYDM